MHQAILIVGAVNELDAVAARLLADAKFIRAEFLHRVNPGVLLAPHFMSEVSDDR